jgi:hypothetical protein
MAKKRKTQYTRQRNRVTSYIRKLRKTGLVVDMYFPTEHELRKSGVNGTELTKLTRELKKIKPKELRSVAKPVSITKQVPTNTPEFEPPTKKVMQDSGYMMYHNVFDDFISRISTPTPELTYYGNKRQVKNREASERGRVTIYNLTMREVAKVGEVELGWRLEKHSDEVQDLIMFVLYGSDASKIASATSRLASIITGGLSVPELMDLAYEEEANEDWELPE